MARARAFLPVDVEMAAADEARYQRDLISIYQRQPGSAQTAALAGSLYSVYPWMQPGVSLALARAGYGPDSTEAQQVAEVAGKAKRKRGFGWHSIGDVFDTAKDTALGGVKAASRGALTVAESGYQYGEAAFRGVAEDVREGDYLGAVGRVGQLDPHFSLPGDPAEVEAFRQTDLGVAEEQALRGHKPDLGGGFFPGGEVAAERQRRAVQAGAIAGQPITPGRVLAYQITEPGTREYNLLATLTDLGLQIAFDPGARVIGATSELRKLHKTFQAIRPIPHNPTDELILAGGAPGIRHTTVAENVDRWLDSSKGRSVREYLTNEQDMQRVWDRTNRKLPADLAAKLADARTDDEVMALLRPALGVTVREAPQLAGWARTGVRNVSYKSRLFATMPGDKLPIHDAQQAVEQLDRLQRNARMGRDVIAKNNGRLARATTREQVYAVVTDVLGEAEGVLQQAGVRAPTARRLTQLWEDAHEDLRRWAVDEIGENQALPWAMVDGAGKSLPTPHLYNEFLNHAIPLPDAREIRRATGRLGKVINYEVNGVRPIERSVALADFVTQKIFKPFVLLRGAWAVRVVGEEQFRLGGAGKTSLVSHPISHIAWMTGRKGNVAVTGDALDSAEEFSAAMSRGSGGLLDRPGVVRVRGKITYKRSDEQYVPAWADELSQLAADPIARQVATDRQAASEWFLHGRGAALREELATAPQLANLGNDVGAMERYLDTVYDRIRIKTSGHPELVDAIATGKLKDIPLRTLGRDRETTAKFVKELQRYHADGVGPQKVLGDLIAHGKQRVSTYDRATQWMFNTLMSRPTNYLSRSPAFRQFYWERVKELANDLDPQDASMLADNATKAGFNTEEVASLRNLAERGSARLKIDDMDTLAKGHGLDSTRKLLYDLHERSQFADITRNIFPFAQAWQEILATWTRIGVAHPEVLRKGQIIVEGARGSGFFHEDENGNEVFTYPGSEWLTKQALGVPVPLKARVQGLNLFSTALLPGFGPVVQYPVAAFVPDTPDWDFVRDHVLPFGAPDTTGGVIESFLPAWVQKLRVGLDIHPTGEQQRLFANTVMDMQRALLTTGDYDINTISGQAKLNADAKKRARLLYVLRGAVQWGAPSAPEPKFMAKDKDGAWVTAQGLVSALDEIRAEVKQRGGDMDEATLEFLDRYGPDAVLYMQGKTRAVVPGLEPSKAAVKWAHDHGDLVRDYPDTYGWLAPTGGDFDFTSYRRQIRRGEREALKPAEAIRLANSRLASLLYRRARAKVGDNPDQDERRWLGQFRDELEKKFPGYGDQYGRGADLATVVKQLTAAATDKRLDGVPQARAFRVYLNARTKAQEAAEAAGYAGFGSAKAMRPARDWLAGIGARLAARVPEFAPVWERLLSKEVD